jgi:hypothetical protein
MGRVDIKNQSNSKRPSFDFGVVSGVLVVNEDVEVVIEFRNGLSQLTKLVFTEQFRVFDENDDEV